MSESPERFVYFIRPIGKQGPIKIGYSTAPQHRLAALVLWSPFPLEVAAIIPTDSQKLEHAIQCCFAHAHYHHEWFHPVPELVDAVRRIGAGEPFEAVLDLTKRTGNLRKGRNNGWTPEKRAAFSIECRERAAWWKARNAALLVEASA